MKQDVNYLQEFQQLYTNVENSVLELSEDVDIINAEDSTLCLDVKDNEGYFSEYVVKTISKNFITMNDSETGEELQITWEQISRISFESLLDLHTFLNN